MALRPRHDRQPAYFAGNGIKAPVSRVIKFTHDRGCFSVVNRTGNRSEGRHVLTTIAS